MNTKLVEEIASAVLYEGYMLYPYRASAIKNKQRWNFGVLYPRSYAEQQTGADGWNMRTEVLIQSIGAPVLKVRVRFLQLIARIVDEQSWQGATEREIALPPINLTDSGRLCYRKNWKSDPAENQEPVEVLVETQVRQLGENLFKIRVDISNTGAYDGLTRDAALMRSLVSTHAIFGVEEGEFISLLEPADEFREVAGKCENRGAWPVLVGENGERDTMLASPIILYDYPTIAPESPGALFDGTEIDEILTLRIMTLTDEEKRQMSQADERTRQILERTESMPPEQFMKMHGILRNVPGGQ